MDRRIATLGLVWALAWAGCGDDDSGGPSPDAEVGNDAGGDAGVGDTESPRVTSTRPRPLEDAVDRTATVSVRFSEPVVIDSGTFTVEGPDGAVSIETPEWSDERDTADFGPVDQWPGGATLQVAVAGFEDLAGNVMEARYELVFSTSDEGAPTVVATSPEEGATDVATDPLTVSITFSEPMNPLLGTLILDGAGTLGEAMWSSETELRAELTGHRARTSASPSRASRTAARTRSIPSRSWATAPSISSPRPTKRPRP